MDFRHSGSSFSHIPGESYKRGQESPSQMPPTAMRMRKVSAGASASTLSPQLQLPHRVKGFWDKDSLEEVAVWRCVGLQVYSTILPQAFLRCQLRCQPAAATGSPCHRTAWSHGFPRFPPHPSNQKSHQIFPQPPWVISSGSLVTLTRRAVNVSAKLNLRLWPPSSSAPGEILSPPYFISYDF